MDTSKSASSQSGRTGQSKSYLSHEQIAMIEEALAALGDFGELRLIKENGRLRFLVTQQSFDVLKWRPGTIKR